MKCPDFCSCKYELKITCNLKNVKNFDIKILEKEEKNIKIIEIKNVENILNIFSSKNLLILKIIETKIENVLNNFLIPNVGFLNLTKNLIKKLEVVNRKSKILQILDISYNPLENLNYIENFEYLNYLDASYTKIKNLGKNLIKNLLKLNILILKGCIFNEINDDIFKLNEPKKIDLRNSILPYKKIKNFIKNIKKIEIFKSDYFSLCCYFNKNIKSIKKCYPSFSIFKTCNDLISSNILKGIIWIFGFLCIIQNLLIIFLNIKKSNLKTSAFSLSLSFSDLAIGIYLISISIKNLIFQGEFFNYEEIWIQSKFCYFLGFLMNFSILNSSISIFFMSLQKYLVIKFPLKQTIFSLNKIFFIILIYMFISFLLAILPSFLYQVLLIFYIFFLFLFF